MMRLIEANKILQLVDQCRQRRRPNYRVGYVEAIGVKQHEQLHKVDQLSVRRNGARVR